MVDQDGGASRCPQIDTTLLESRLKNLQDVGNVTTFHLARVEE
eukprot:SAG11_NODE_3286_length_2552_cov_2.992662_2_plen_43_part_00